MIWSGSHNQKLYSIQSSDYIATQIEGFLQQKFKN